jgi:hypothetical protein
MARCNSCGHDRYSGCRCLLVDDPAGSTVVHGDGSTYHPYYVEAIGGGTQVAVDLEEPIRDDRNQLLLWFDPDAPPPEPPPTEGVLYAWVDGAWVPIGGSGTGGGGTPGPPGTPGSRWYDGPGPPPDPYPGARAGDYYLDTVTGDVYLLEADPGLVTLGLRPDGITAMIGVAP